MSFDMKRICLAKIVAAHGVKGLVKIKPFGEDVSLLNGKMFIDETGNKTVNIKLKNALGKYILANVEGSTDRNHAEALRGTDLYIARDDMPELEDAFYFEDLIGMNVVDQAGKALGKIINADNFGASDLIEIQGAVGTFMLPFTDDYIVETTDDAVIIKDFEMFL